MFRRKAGSRATASPTSLHFANRNAYPNMTIATPVRVANDSATMRHLEQACARLQDAAEELESVVAAMPTADGQADLHEAIGSIMETLLLVASAHARLDRPERDAALPI